MHESVRIAEKAIGMLLGASASPHLLLVSAPGSSGARVSIFRDARTGFLYAVKCVINPRVSLVEELARKELLIPYLEEHLPRILWCQIVDGYEVMISECKGTDTLHNLILANASNTVCLPIWEEVIDCLVRLWKTSKHEYIETLSPRFFPARVQRIEQGVRETTIGSISLSQCWDMTVKINGKEYPSLSQSFKAIASIDAPEFGVLCQGDPQPSNVIVTPDHSWYCVDWEWTGYHQDWRMMVSHLVGWWSTRCLEIKGTPRATISSSHLELEYQAEIPDYIRAYRETALRAPELLLEKPPDKNTLLDINKYLAALYFGEIRFLTLWSREALFVPMLAQAIMTAKDQGQNPENVVFQFPV